MKNIIQRIISIVIPVTLQFFVLWLILSFASKYSTIILIIIEILAVIFILSILSKRQDGTYKSLWLLLILSFPILGSIFYMLWGNRNTSRKLQRQIDNGITKHKTLTHEVSESLADKRPRLTSTLRYMEELTDFDVVKNSDIKYYHIGEDLFEAMLEEMKMAKESIYLEYFIVDDGHMWRQMLSVLKEKAMQGLDIRFIFDDLGSLKTFSNQNIKQLEDSNIKYLCFNKIGFLTGALNNRDHRKMLIVDSAVAFSGGINLADEYINHIVKYGHWKDIGFRATGEIAGRYLTLFVDFWNSFSKEKIEFDNVIKNYSQFEKNNGYSLTYYDNPNNEIEISNTLYIEFLNISTKRAYFYTPYLMLGDRLYDTVINTAKRGVDVQIITPHIGDSPVVHRITRSYYKKLVEAGVKIYEYTPGYVHAKATIFDDDVCSIGTVNLDFRSLFLHYECNTIFVDSNVHSELLKDFENTRNMSSLITLEDCKKGFLGRFLNGVLRVVAPLC